MPAPASPASASAPGSPVLLHAAPENERECPDAPERPPYTPHIPLGVGRVLVFPDENAENDDVNDLSVVVGSPAQALSPVGGFQTPSPVGGSQPPSPEGPIFIGSFNDDSEM